MSRLTNIKNQTVIVRTCFDLPSPEDLNRVKDSKETIDLLLKNGNKVIMVSHWGRPESSDQSEFSFQKIQSQISEVLGQKLVFVDQFKGFMAAREIIQNSNQKLFLLENSRFLADEQSKDSLVRSKLAENYASLAEVFVDEAFAVSHRREATNYDLAKLLPSFVGLSFQRELDHLDRLKNQPERPFVVQMAGAKLETKLDLIQKIITKADKLLLGGKLCFTFLKAARELGLARYSTVDFGKSGVEDSFLDQAKELLQSYPEVIELPIDFIYGDKEANKIELNSPVEEYFAYDLGPKTVDRYKSVLATARTIFWNGPVGYYENPEFAKGTVDLGNFMASLDSTFRVIGGGDTGASLKPEVLKKFDWVSMGGGATLEYLSS